MPVRHHTRLRVCAHLGLLVGIVANNGILFSESAQRAHFIELCNQRGVPLIFPQTSPASWSARNTRRRHCQRWRQDGHRRVLRQVPKFTVDRRQLRRRQLRHVRPPFNPRFPWMWPNARISVMGGEQAASVLATVKRDGIETPGGTWEQAEEEAASRHRFASNMRIRATRTTPPRASGDGIIDPKDTRMVLGLALSASMNATDGKPTTACSGCKEPCP